MISGFGRVMYAFAGLGGLLAVALAALAAHALAGIAPTGDQAVIWFKEATAFQMSHVLGLAIVTGVTERLAPGRARRVMRAGAVLMAAAAVLFPGALYSASFNGPVFLAPVGGIAAMAGWALFAVGALMARGPSA